MPAFRRRYDCRYPLFHRLYSVVHGGDDSPQTCCASAAGAPLKREEEPGHRCAPLRLRRAPSRWRGQGARRCVNRRGAPGGPAIVLRPERRRYGSVAVISRACYGKLVFRPGGSGFPSGCPVSLLPVFRFSGSSLSLPVHLLCATPLEGDTLKGLRVSAGLRGQARPQGVWLPECVRRAIIPAWIVQLDNQTQQAWPGSFWRPAEAAGWARRSPRFFFPFWVNPSSPGFRKPFAPEVCSSNAR